MHRHDRGADGGGRDDGPAPLIAAVGVGVAVGQRTILDGIDVAVHPRVIVTVVGPNGAGKTTLIRVLLGLIAPSAGSVRRRPGLRVGYLPQRVAFDPVLPLNVGRLMTLTVRRSREEVLAALAETGSAHLIAVPVQSLSGGELQRVLLARALLRDPDLLVLDEPVQGVDFTGEADLYRLIGSIRRRRGCGVLMVSHDLHVVMAETDQVVCVNRHVCCAGPPEQVTRHPAYLALFGARAAAFAVYPHHHDHAHGPGGEVVPLAPPPASGAGGGRQAGG
ncbi:MAG: ATP-binding cassette domain-containing protein [Rhodospirillales bacterium]|nr:MAG: ATP-binding cassette domain-containing protein [Rhodospirillales bacterium]